MNSLQALSPAQLREIRDALSQRILEGLAAPRQEIQALPAHLAPPSPDVRGQALVVDAGGTNMRAAWLDLGEGAVLKAGPLGGTLPDGRDREVDQVEFFSSQAELVRKLGAPPGLPLGYCFSYAAEALPSGDARLLHWTKGIQVKGVVGSEVGRALAEAIGAVPRVKVLNDTVAALLGGAYAGRAKHRNFIGLIVGTGTNMAAFFETARITKLEGSGFPAEMAVNLESGNFHPPHLESWDEAVDAASDNPGRARVEKAVSGFYLPYVLERICPDIPGFDPTAGAGAVVELRQHGSGYHQQAASYLLDRSADLVAAKLAGLMALLPEGSVGIQAEGGLFWKAPGYRERVEATLTQLAGQREFEILHQDNVNLVGAACAAVTE